MFSATIINWLISPKLIPWIEANPRLRDKLEQDQMYVALRALHGLKMDSENPRARVEMHYRGLEKWLNQPKTPEALSEVNAHQWMLVDFAADVAYKHHSYFAQQLEKLSSLTQQAHEYLLGSDFEERSAMRVGAIRNEIIPELEEPEESLAT